MADERERIADERERVADERESLADARESLADEREVRASRSAAALATSAPLTADMVDWLAQDAASLSAHAAQRQRRDDRADRADRGGDLPSLRREDAWTAERREFVADDRQEQADERDLLADERDSLADARDVHRGEMSPVDHAGDHPVGARRVSDEQALRALAAVRRDDAGLARQTADGERAATGGSHPLAAEFVKIGKYLLDAETVELGMADVVDASVRFVNGCDAASFSALVGDVVTTIASSSAVAVELDDAQYRTAEGPCLQAIRTLQMVISEDLARDERWPEFVAAAAGSAGSAMATPVVDDRPTKGPFGSLNSYGLRTNAFDGDDADTAVLLTAHLGVLLVMARAAQESSDLATQLLGAVTTRDVIGQAKGILMERDGLTAAQAFDVLRGASQRLNRKLRDVAEDLAVTGEVIVPRS